MRPFGCILASCISVVSLLVVPSANAAESCTESSIFLQRDTDSVVNQFDSYGAAATIINQDVAFDACNGPVVQTVFMMLDTTQLNYLEVGIYEKYETRWWEGRGPKEYYFESHYVDGVYYGPTHLDDVDGVSSAIYVLEFSGFVTGWATTCGMCESEILTVH